jgi:hypothetical protein
MTTKASTFQACTARKALLSIIIGQGWSIVAFDFSFRDLSFLAILIPLHLYFST